MIIDDKKKGLEFWDAARAGKNCNMKGDEEILKYKKSNE